MDSKQAKIFKMLQKVPPNEIKRILKEHPSIVSIRDDDGKTALHIASEMGNVALVRLLMQRKMDANVTDSNGWTPLHCASNKAHFEVCEELLRSKTIDVSISNDDSTTALVYLVRLRASLIPENKLQLYLKVLKSMVQKGANVNAINSFGEAPLHAACLRGTIHSVTFLLNSNANVNVLNSKTETALHWAVRMSKVDVVKVLMEYAADPFITSSSGPSPMELAIQESQQAVISLMTAKALLCEEASKECAKTGFLEIHIRKGNWEKNYCVLKEQTLFVYPSDNPKEKPKATYDIREIEINEFSGEKNKNGRTSIFKLAGPHRQTMFAATNDVECKDWIKCVLQGQRIYTHLLSAAEKIPSNQENDTSSAKVVLEPEEINGHLIRILEESSNMVCADCGVPEAFWMLHHYGALVCFDCADVHAKLKTSAIKSIHFDSWLLDDVMVLRCNGNAKHNNKLESSMVLSVVKPNIDSTREEREAYITAKYQHDEKKSKSTDDTKPELKRVLSSHIAKFHSIYNIHQLQQALSISEALWKCLENTALYTNILNCFSITEGDTAVSPKTSTGLDLVLKTLSEPKYSCVIGYARVLLLKVIPFIQQLRSVFTKVRKQQLGSLTATLREILTVYEQLQREAFDPSLKSIFQWWLPQIVELLAMAQCIQSQELLPLVQFIVKHSAMALYLSTGEYLIFEPDPYLKKLTIPTDEAASNIRAKCKNHTENLRKLLISTYKYSATHTSMDDSRSDASLPSDAGRKSTNTSVVRVNSADFLLNRTSSYTWSHTSTGDQSPRELGGTNEFLAEETEYPLIQLFNQSPVLGTALCNVAAELPENLQSTLLGVVSAGHSFVETHNEGWDDIFSMSSWNITKCLYKIHAHLENMRLHWPETIHMRQVNVSEYAYALVLKHIYILKRHLRVMYGLSVSWNIPEVWTLWIFLQDISNDVVNFLIASAHQEKDRSEVLEILCFLIVHVRWTHSKLREIQTLDYAVNN